MLEEHLQERMFLNKAGTFSNKRCSRSMATSVNFQIDTSVMLKF
jgi:hypothetical protein